MVKAMVEIQSVNLSAERAEIREQRERQIATLTARERAKVIARERAIIRSRRTQTALTASVASH